MQETRRRGCVQERVLGKQKAKQPDQSAGRLEADQHPVPAIPPSRSGELPTRVGLLTPKLRRLHAFSRPVPRGGGRNGSKQPASAPGHSGGAVPESHRSSLFARRKQGFRPATRVGGRVYRLRKGCQSSGPWSRHPQGLPRRPPVPANPAARDAAAREAVTVVRGRAAQFAEAVSASVSPQCAAAKQRAKNPRGSLKPLSRCRR